MSEDEESDECCEDSVKTDALALIQQKEQENAEQAERIKQLEAQNAELLENIMWMEAERDDFKRAIRRLEAERDAAVEALKNGDVCESCKHFGTLMDEEPCAWCSSLHSNFEWRGVPKEE